MRRVLLLLLLIALLPLRAWAGDAMAIQMAAQAHSHRMATMAEASAPHAKCHEMQAEPAAPHTSPTQDHCETCASCQACFTVAITVPAMPSATQPLPHGQPQAASAQFTSAILALGQKPPIS